MICPKCRTEYRAGFTRCSDCDVALVAALEPAARSAPSALDRPALAWRGDDPVVFSAVLAALGDAEIPNYQMSQHEQLPLEPAVPRPLYGIFVRRGDVTRAERVIRKAIGTEADE
jgi:hypothetical protein